MSGAPHVSDPSGGNDAAEKLVTAKARYAQRNPKSFERWKYASAAMPGGNTRTVLFFEPFPLCMARGEGCFLFDVDGHRYYDLLGEYTAGIYGHSHPSIRAAVMAALDSGISLSAHNEAEGELANEILRRFPSMELLRFTNSGTEANLMALATAIAVTGRRRILVFENAYHGGVLSFGDGRSPINVPHEFVIAPYNDVDRVRAVLRDLGSELAAILVEPMLGAGGCIPADPAFLALLASEARRLGALLIFDEIQTSRLSPGGRQQLLGISPDLTTLGKYLGGGFSFGAFGGRADVMSAYDPRKAGHFTHAGTFNNNVFSMYAGLAGLKKVLTPRALIELNVRGDALRESLNLMFAELGTGLRATGLGSIMNVHMSGAGDASRAARELLFFELLERGFYIAQRGLITLSLPVTDEITGLFVATAREIVESHLDVFRAPIPSSSTGGE
jgi:glutamate-1-semialdehyde 2,1-aminomutase